VVALASLHPNFSLFISVCLISSAFRCIWFCCSLYAVLSSLDSLRSFAMALGPPIGAVPSATYLLCLYHINTIRDPPVYHTVTAYWTFIATCCE
jgi:hypothetical protein